MKPYGSRPWAPVECECQRTAGGALTVQTVGNKKHLGLDLSIPALDRKPPSGSGIFQQLAIHGDLMMGHHWGNFSKVVVFFFIFSLVAGRLLRSLRLLLLGRRRRSRARLRGLRRILFLGFRHCGLLSLVFPVITLRRLGPLRR